MKIYYSEHDIPADLSSDSLVFLPDHYGKGFSYLWDDYGYKTTFRVYFVHKKTNFDLGFAKILFKNKTNSHEFIKNTFSEVNGIYVLSNLRHYEFVSIGSEITYYRRLNKYFNNNKHINTYLKLINDACYLKFNGDDYTSWNGFKDSLLRDSSGTSILEKGYAIAKGNYKHLEKFTFSVDTPFKKNLSFSFDRKDQLSGNINLIIGKNGNGKTATLQNISDIFVGLKRNIESWPYFNKLIVVSFSPFENFYSESELRRMLSHEEEIEERPDLINEYTYVGLKSSSSRFDLSSIKEKSARSYIDAIKYDRANSWWAPTSKINLIDETLKQAMKYSSIAFKGLDGELIKSECIYNDFNLIDKVDFSHGLIFLTKDEKEMKLSSGQMIYSLFTPRIVSEIKEESLILIDEPELYLHPELEVGLISMLKVILRDTKSFAIVATHSSVIAREVKSDYIHVIRDSLEIEQPEVETIGNSLDRITGEIFGDYDIEKPFQKMIDDILSNSKDIDKTIEALTSEFGSKGISYIYELKRKRKLND